MGALTLIRCAVCDEDVFDDEEQECQVCGRKICPDCSIVFRHAEDDWRIVCNDCYYNAQEIAI